MTERTTNRAGKQLNSYSAFNASRTTAPVSLDVSDRMRRRDEASLKLRRREINTALQTSVKKPGEHFQIASLRAGEIDNRRRSKEQTKHRTEPVKGDVDVCALDRVSALALQIGRQTLRAISNHRFAPIRAIAQDRQPLRWDFRTMFLPDTQDRPAKVGP